MSVSLRVLADPAAACAQLLVQTAAAGGHVVLTGGSTPGVAYQQAALSPEAWDQATVWFGDERCVPPEDRLSNYRMARETLLSHVMPAAVHRIEGELGPHQAAARYERELKQAGEPAFDLLLLGLGPDGHIASLFPDQPTLSERSRLVVGVERAGFDPFVPRVSMTLPELAHARRIVFLVRGEAKAEAVAAAFGPRAEPRSHVPASLLPPLAGDITVLLDSAAASRLHAGGISS